MLDLEEFFLSDHVLAHTEALFEQGLIIIMGLPIAIVSNKKGTLSMGHSSPPHALKVKRWCKQNLNSKNGQCLHCCVLNLNFSNLPTIINGPSNNDEQEDWPFNVHFTKEKIATLVMEERRACTI